MGRKRKVENVELENQVEVGIPIDENLVNIIKKRYETFNFDKEKIEMDEDAAIQIAQVIGIPVEKIKRHYEIAICDADNERK